MDKLRLNNNFIMKYKYTWNIGLENSWCWSWNLKQVKIMLWNLNKCDMGIAIIRMLDLK